MSQNAESVPPEGLFAGKYRLHRMIGKGAMGEVWLAEEEGPRNFRRRVAVKKLISTSEIGDLATSSFVAEAQVIAKLDHHNIVRLIELGTFEGDLYLVLDYVDGAALDRLIKRKLGGGPLSPAAVAYVGREIAQALESVHSLCDEQGRNYGVVHRDVTPSNILVSRDGRVRLSDFGVARISGFAGDKTETGIFKGKLPYMPPEQARGEPFDGRADIYALGTTLFEALLGQRPRRAETQTQLIMMIATERCPYVQQVLPGCPPALAAAIDSATEIDPARRVPDGGRLAADLDMALRAMGPNALKEAKEELKARVEAVAGPPPQSTTQSGARHLGSDPGKRDSWSLSLHGGVNTPPPPPPEPSWSGNPGSGSGRIAAPPYIAGSPGTGSHGPFSHPAPSQPPSSQLMSTGAHRTQQRSILIASVLGLVGAAAATALVLRVTGSTSKDGGSLPEATTTAAVVAPTAVETAAPTATEAAAPTATSAADQPPTAPKTAVQGPINRGPIDRGKPKPDSSGAATAAPDVDPSSPGSLQVVVNPWGDVIVDGKSVGTTPMPAIQLAPGPHSVVVKNAELGATRSASVTIKPGQTASVRFDLRRTE